MAVVHYVIFVSVWDLSHRHKLKYEGRSIAFAAFHGNTATHLVNDLLTNGETQTSPVGVFLFWISKCVKIHKQTVKFVLRNSAAKVSNQNLETDVATSVLAFLSMASIYQSIVVQGLH